MLIVYVNYRNCKVSVYTSFTGRDIMEVNNSAIMRANAVMMSQAKDRLAEL